MKTVDIPNRRFFDRLPNDITKLVFAFLQGDDKTVVAISAVCRRWRNDLVRVAEREYALRRLRQRICSRDYPLKIRELFNRCNYPIWGLPVLDLGDCMGKTGYIDFIQPEEMNRSVMQFRDRYRRSGVALKIQVSPTVRRQREIQVISRLMKKAIRTYDLPFIIDGIRKIGSLLLSWGHTEENVLALFKRFSDSETWVHAWGNSDDTIKNLYKWRYPGSDDMESDAGLELLLTNQHPDFKLASRHKGIPQRMLIVAALAALAIAYLANRYLVWV
jgi:hypothetical protein